jgi:hypothetical protein
VIDVVNSWHKDDESDLNETGDKQKGKQRQQKECHKHQQQEQQEQQLQRDAIAFHTPPPSTPSHILPDIPASIALVSELSQGWAARTSPGMMLLRLLLLLDLSPARCTEQLFRSAAAP